MAEQYSINNNNNNGSVQPAAETKEPGCFDFIRKKENKPPQEDDLVMTDLKTEQDGKPGEKHSLMDELLQRTHNHSGTSSDEEVEEGGERKKKKKMKGLKDAITEKIIGHPKEGEQDTEIKDACITTEKLKEEENGEKKGFIEKIKEKLPGQHNTGEVDNQIPPAYEHYPGSDPPEKKGIMDKIKEKLPGHHKTNGNEVKED